MPTCLSVFQPAQSCSGGVLGRTGSAWAADAPGKSFSQGLPHPNTGISPEATGNVTGAQFQHKTKPDDFSAPTEPIYTSCVPEYTEKLEEAWKLNIRKHKSPKDKIITNVICILLNLISN